MAFSSLHQTLVNDNLAASFLEEKKHPTTSAPPDFPQGRNSLNFRKMNDISPATSDEEYMTDQEKATHYKYKEAKNKYTESNYDHRYQKNYVEAREAMMKLSEATDYSDKTEYESTQEDVTDCATHRITSTDVSSHSEQESMSEAITDTSAKTSQEGWNYEYAQFVCMAQPADRILSSTANGNPELEDSEYETGQEDIMDLSGCESLDYSKYESASEDADCTGDDVRSQTDVMILPSTSRNVILSKVNQTSENLANQIRVPDSYRMEDSEYETTPEDKEVAEILKRSANHELSSNLKRSKYDDT